MTPYEWAFTCLFSSSRPPGHGKSAAAAQSWSPASASVYTPARTLSLMRTRSRVASCRGISDRYRPRVVTTVTQTLFSLNVQHSDCSGRSRILQTGPGRGNQNFLNFMQTFGIFFVKLYVTPHPWWFTVPRSRRSLIHSWQGQNVKNNQGWIQREEKQWETKGRSVFVKNKKSNLFGTKTFGN